MTTILLYLFMGLTAFANVADNNSVTADATFRSVELGLAELSPAGTLGGYAVPASGASYSCSLGLSPNSVISGASVTASWTHGAGGVVSGGGGMMGGGDGGSIQQPFDVALFRCNDGTSCTGNPLQQAGTCLLGDCYRGGAATGNWSVVGQRVGATSPGSFTAGTSGLANGSYLYRLVAHENTYTHAHSEMCDATLTIVGAPAADPVTLDLTADDYLISVGSSTTLRWDTTNADYCTTSNGWSGSRVPDSNESTGPLLEDTTYNMICYNNNGQASNPDTVTVRVNDIVGEVDSCDGNTVVRQGEEFCMEYEVNEPGACVIRLGNNEILGPLTSTTGQFTWTLNSQGTFTLYCDGVVDSVTIKVLPEFQET